RIAAVNNKAADPNGGNNIKLVLGVDGVHFSDIFDEGTAAPTIAGLQLRNASLVGGTPSTSDPTFVGQVQDPGSSANVKFVQFTTTDPITGQTITFKDSTFDATGHFSFSLPLTVPGPYSVQITAQNRAGNVFNQTVNFTFQGPSTTTWQAQGPGPIQTAGVGYATVSGRIMAIAVDPRDSSGNTFYVGAANGGVWKTTDGGQDYTPLT